MKTRIIHTKIYDDTWFLDLSLETRFLFVYFFTNSRIGHTGIYEIPDQVINFETGVSNEQLQKAKDTFEKSQKIYFRNQWIFVVKSPFYGGYLGTKNEVAYKNELISIPQEVRDYFYERAKIEYRYSIDRVSGVADTPINHKSEIINHKSEEYLKLKKTAHALIGK